MKPRIACLATLCLMLAAVSAYAGNDGNCQSPDCGGQPWSYNNGPINGTTDAWTINFGYIVSDTFVAGGSRMDNFAIGVWEYPGDSVISLQWSITSGENGGTVYGSGTAGRYHFPACAECFLNGSSLTDRFISTNQYGYDMDLISVTGLNVSNLTSGQTYWLNLFNATVSNGDPVYWDENSGNGCSGMGCPSKASESAIGTIPSEAFTIGATYQLEPSGTPEPSGILLLGSGVLVVLGVVRRKLNL